MNLEIEVSIGEKYSNIAKASISIDADPLPDADLTAIVAHLIASVKAKAAAKLEAEAAKAKSEPQAAQ